MKFSIITPTYNRPEKLERAILSVTAQGYQNWEMIIINDGPDAEGYSAVLEKFTDDKRVRYFVQDKNRGVNAARNRGLDTVSPDSDFVVLLDDDDFFVPNVLEILYDLATKYPDSPWILTNRALADGTSITRVPQSDKKYHYARDYLLLRRAKGDATHCMSTQLIRKHNLRFATHIRQAEEWLFFFQLGTKARIFYHNANTTLSDGYDTTSGLNFRPRTKREQFKTLLYIIKEGWNRSLLMSPYFLLYVLLRFVRIALR